MSATSVPPTLRERRKRETREEIRRVALALVREHGYDGVTVELISQGAGVSVRTFFNYFASKESAMIALPPPLPESAVDRFLAGRGFADLFADLADLAVSSFEQGTAVPSDFEASIQTVMGVPALAHLQAGALAEREAQFVELIAQRLDLHADDGRPAVISAAFTGAIRVAARRWTNGLGSKTFTDEIRACLRILSTTPAVAYDDRPAPKRARAPRKS